MNEYIIISKTAIQQRIEELEKDLQDEPNPFLNTSYQTELDTLKQILSQSTPLIPEIEKAFDAGFKTKQQGILMKKIEYTQQRQDYIANLKLDI